MPLCLFPEGAGVDGPEVSWSYSGFHTFRQRLAQAEGFALTEMHGFGGGRP